MIRIISVTTRYAAQNATAAVTSQTNKRHMVAVKELILVMLVYVIRFLPLLLTLNVSGAVVWFVYLLYINHVANFFIYLAVNKDFRNETKTMINAILKNVRPEKEQSVFVLSKFRSDVSSDSPNQCRT